ncbi:ketoacyl-ACP synthase III [Flavobacterium ginsengisoli]|uniref:Ketoacyl-ACP synthase III n=1 Tax=Flavobacterium ginsengisoli TaxID=871694 RepID=A0ABP7FC83_9FLAO
MDAYINGISYYLPEKAITNDELQEIFPEWEVDKVASRIGVEKRYLSSTTEFTSDLAIAAANKLIEDYNIDKSSVDYLIICSQTPDYLLPATSCIVQDKTGLPKSIGALDINLGCSGYIYGLGFAKGLIFSGQAKNIIFVTSETLTKFIHQDDKANRALFGDAATATFITSEPNKDFFSAKIKNFKYGTDGSGYDKLIIKNSAGHLNKKESNSILDDDGNFVLNDDYLYMNGTEIFNFTAFEIPKLIKNILDVNNLTLDDLSMTVLHQANSFMLDFIRKRSGIASEKMYINLLETGNTLSSTIPIALCKLIENNQIKEHNKILLSGFGVGLSMAGVIIEN